ncbi:MAG: alpha-galactosidase, partial [Mobilitalea sp.]
MAVSILRKYSFKDTDIVYVIDSETKNVGLMLLPEGMEPVEWEQKKQIVDSLVQIKLAGDIYPGAYAGGVTLRQGESTFCLTCEQQDVVSFEDRDEVITTLIDQRGYKVEHYLQLFKDSDCIETYNVFHNLSKKDTTLEMISSFSLGGITPFTGSDAYDTLKVHRIRSVWSMEGRLESTSLEDLQLEPSWAGHAV